MSWAAAGLVGYGLYELGRAVFGDTFSWDNAGPYLAGGIIVAAGVYQLTPLKDVCLRYCRSPMMFFLSHSHPGRIGALRMGVEHGGFCVGCCWMLMAALFALGVMSIGWMAFIAALIAVEKLLPWKDVANRGIAVLLLGSGSRGRLRPGPGAGPHAARVRRGESGDASDGHGARRRPRDRRWGPTR